MNVAEAQAFLRENHHGVLVTKKRDGSNQTSPITIGIDEEGRAVISSRETAYKVKNLEREPSATVCAFTDGFFGPWVQVEGMAEIVRLPEAMELLVDYYRRLSGEHPDWDEYRSVMKKDRRVVIRFDIASAGPNRAG